MINVVIWTSVINEYNKCGSCKNCVNKHFPLYIART